MHVTVSSCTNHISRYIYRQRSRFPRNGSLLLIGQSWKSWKGMQSSTEQLLVGEEHCMTTLITAAKENTFHKVKNECFMGSFTRKVALLYMLHSFCFA